MKRLILALSAIALIASANVASARTLHRGHGAFVHSNVGLLHSDAGFRAAQPYYPQSPAGIGGF